MAVNKRFKLKKKIEESTYNQKVAGSNKLGKGEHLVTLTSVEEVDSEDWHAYDLIWQDENGATAKERTFITFEDRETKERDISDKFHKLGLALAGGDNKLGYNFFADTDEGAYCDVERMQLAVGCKAIIRIGLPKKGTAIKNIDNEMFAFDIESGEIIDEVGGHADIKDLIAVCREIGLKLKFNQVLSHKVSREDAASNIELLNNALESSKVTEKKTNVVDF